MIAGVARSNPRAVARVPGTRGDFPRDWSGPTHTQIWTGKTGDTLSTQKRYVIACETGRHASQPHCVYEKRVVGVVDPYN